MVIEIVHRRADRTTAEVVSSIGRTNDSCQILRINVRSQLQHKTAGSTQPASFSSSNNCATPHFTSPPHDYIADFENVSFKTLPRSFTDSHARDGYDVVVLNVCGGLAAAPNEGVRSTREYGRGAGLECRRMSRGGRK